MRIWEESGIEFDLRACASAVKHDKENVVWPAVDFIIPEPDRSIWLEVKNWEPSSLPPKYRGGNRRSFLSKVRSLTFYNDLRGKFLGTTSYLSWTGRPPTMPVVYVVMLESRRMDSALKKNATDRLANLIPISIPKSGGWSWPINVAVVDLDDWNALFPAYPARRL